MKLPFLRALCLLSTAASGCSSSSSETATTDTGTVADSAAVDTAVTDSGTDTLVADSVTDTLVTDAAPDARDGSADVASDAPITNKCRMSAGVGFTLVDCAPGKVCVASSTTATCEPSTDAATAPCGTISCGDSCTCADAASSICDCFGAAIGPLAPPDLVS